MDTERPKRQVVNGDRKLQGWVSKEDKERIEFLIEKKIINNESDAVREGSRALWREYLKYNLKVIESGEQEPDLPEYAENKNLRKDVKTLMEMNDRLNIDLKNLKAVNDDIREGWDKTLEENIVLRETKE